MDKAIIISVANHKGGVGKTATTVGLGGALQSKGFRVLLIDADGQANLTDSLGFSMDMDKTLYEALKGKEELPICKHKDGIDVVPACLDLSAAEVELMNEPGRETILSSLLQPIRQNYDFILIDCPPSLSLLTLNAMTASDSLIIPVQAEYLAMRGMGKLINVIDKVKKRLNANLKIEGILLTMYDSRKNLHQSVAETVQETFKDDVFATMIRTNVAIAESTSAKQDVFHYAPKSNGAQDYLKLADEVIAHHNL